MKSRFLFVIPKDFIWLLSCPNFKPLICLRWFHFSFPSCHLFISLDSSFFSLMPWQCMLLFARFWNCMQHFLFLFFSLSSLILCLSFLSFLFIFVILLYIVSSLKSLQLYFITSLQIYINFSFRHKVEIIFHVHSVISLITHIDMIFGFKQTLLNWIWILKKKKMCWGGFFWFFLITFIFFYLACKYNTCKS